VEVVEVDPAATRAQDKPTRKPKKKATAKKSSSEAGD